MNKKIDLYVGNSSLALLMITSCLVLGACAPEFSSRSESITFKKRVLMGTETVANAVSVQIINSSQEPIRPNICSTETTPGTDPESLGKQVYKCLAPDGNAEDQSIEVGSSRTYYVQRNDVRNLLPAQTTPIIIKFGDIGSLRFGSSLERCAAPDNLLDLDTHFVVGQTLTVEVTGVVSEKIDSYSTRRSKVCVIR